MMVAALPLGKPTTVASSVISHSAWPHTAEDWMDNKSNKIRGIRFCELKSN